MPTPKEIVTQHGTPGWDMLWQSGSTPWDKGSANPFLVKLLAEPPSEVKRLFEEMGEGGRGLVAGCGRVSAAYLSRRGR
jgi:hypothetical protein